MKTFAILVPMITIFHLSNIDRAYAQDQFASGGGTLTGNPAANEGGGGIETVGVASNAIPEPLSILASVTALGIGAAIHRDYVSAKKN